MARAGRAAKNLIACDIVLMNSKEQWAADSGQIPESSVHRIEVVAELDTGCVHLGLRSKHIKALKLEPLGDTVNITFVLDGKVKKVAMFGPVIVDFGGRKTPVEAYELESTEHPLLGLEVAQRLKIYVDWEHSKIYLLSTAYTHNAFTIGPQDLYNLFGRESETIIALQKEYQVSIEITNRKKVDKIVVFISTVLTREHIERAQTAVKRLCPSLMPTPEEERP